MFFDSASRMGLKGKVITRAGIVYIFLENNILFNAYLLTEPLLNNVAKYNDVVIILQIAERIGVNILKSMATQNW